MSSLSRRWRPLATSAGDSRTRYEPARRPNEAQEASLTAMRHAVSEIRGSGYTARDAGMLLGVSNQRISQIERSGGKKQTRTPGPT